MPEDASLRVTPAASKPVVAAGGPNVPAVRRVGEVVPSQQPQLGPTERAAFARDLQAMGVQLPSEIIGGGCPGEAPTGECPTCPGGVVGPSPSAPSAVSPTAPTGPGFTLPEGAFGPEGCAFSTPAGPLAGSPIGDGGFSPVGGEGFPPPSEGFMPPGMGEPIGPGFTLPEGGVSTVGCALSTPAGTMSGSTLAELGVLGSVGMTVAQEIKTIKVNFNFGKGTTKDKRAEKAKKFVDALNKMIGGKRFGVNFEVGEVGKDEMDDVPENFNPGDWSDPDKPEPGTFKYSDDGIKVTKKYGKSPKEPTVKIIVVKGLRSGATTATGKIKTVNKPEDFQVKDGEKVVDKEAIFYNDDAFSALPDEKEGSYAYTRPAHEFTHLAGLEDNPSGPKYDDKRLNSYASDRTGSLTDADEKQVNGYFDGKVGR